MPGRPNRESLRATLGVVNVSGQGVRVAAARLGALLLLVAAAIVPPMTSVGPIVIIVSSGHGLHALDVGVILVSLPLAVLLLRYADLIGEDEVPVRSWDGHELRRRWASAVAAYRGGVGTLRSDLLLVGTAAFTGGIGVSLALTSSHRAVVIVGGMIVGGTITVVAMHLPDIFTANDSTRDTAHGQPQGEGISTGPEDLGSPPAHHNGQRAMMGTGIDRRGDVQRSASDVVDRPAKPEAYGKSTDTST